MRVSARGFWQESVSHQAECDSLRGKEMADILIVGGGLLGLSTAIEIKKLAPTKEVVLLEEYVCGFAPSGRNGGIVYDYWTSLPELSRSIGYRQALDLAEMSERAVAEIASFKDIDYRKSGALHVSTTPLHDNRAQAKINYLRRSGREDLALPLSAEEVSKRVSSPLFRGGTFYPGVATLHPAKLIRALRRLADECGVRIYENSRLEKLFGQKYMIAETDRGVVFAEQVLLATGSLGAFSARSHLTVASSNMVITRPLENINDFWSADFAITDERDAVRYMQKTVDGRIAFGWGRGSIGSRNLLDTEPDEIAKVAKALSQFFPEVELADIEHAWGGPIDISSTHMPFILRPRKNIFLGAGFTGNGIGGSRVLSKILAAEIVGEEPEIKLPRARRLPPDVLKNFAGGIIRSALLRREEAEQAGELGALHDRALAALPAKLGMRISR